MKAGWWEAPLVLRGLAKAISIKQTQQTNGKSENEKKI